MSEINEIPTTDSADPGDPNDSPETSQSQPIQLTPLAAFLLMVTVFILGLGAGYLIWARPLEARAVAAEQELAMVQSTAVADKTAVANEAAAQPADAKAQVEVPPDVKRYPVPIDDDYILGNKDAKITIIEFSDYECPFCVRWQAEVYPQIEAKYGDQVRLVYRDFPLYSIHPNAEPAAEAANCAGAQDKYYEFHDLLFSGKPLGDQAYQTYAKQLNLDLDAFNKCLDEDTFLEEVKTDYNYASGLGVRSTPTFFINGLAVVGAQPFEVFEQIIDLELAGKIP